MKEARGPKGMERQYDQLAVIVKDLRKQFPQFKFDHWNHADFAIDLGDDEFLELDELMKIDQTLRNYGRGIVLIAPVSISTPGKEWAEEVLEIVTVESSGVAKKNKAKKRMEK